MSKFTKIKLIGPVLGMVLLMPMSGVALADPSPSPEKMVICKSLGETCQKNGFGKGSDCCQGLRCHNEGKGGTKTFTCAKW